MKKKILVLFSIATLLFACNSNNKVTSNRFPQVLTLIQRQIPGYEGQFILDSIASDQGQDVFEIESVNDKIVLRGNCPVAVASAFQWYLKYVCNCQISQAGMNINLPKNLPMVKTKIRQVNQHELRYFLNYCTFNYTTSFWDWKDWEKELDWMAMNGINLALAINGSEEVWQNTMKSLNFSDEDIASFIPGPCYQAWWLMSNLEGWGGPVSQTWIKSRTVLQKQILARMKEFGIEPVFQGFFAMVPTTFKKKFPDAKVFSGGDWCGYPRPDVVDPNDPMFKKAANVFYKEQEKLFGKAKFYGGDLFHEGGNKKGVDLTKCASIVQKSMQNHAPGSKWVLQGWMNNPEDSLLAGLNKEQTLIIDLFCESFPSWKTRGGMKGFPFIWATINNFGGRNGLYGKLDSAVLNLSEARNLKNLGGIGVIPEGIKVNPLVFEFFFELAWHKELPKPAEWIKGYIASRYGKPNANCEKAWAIFLNTIYNIPVKYDEPQNIICSRPSLDIIHSAPWGFYDIRYKQKDFIKGLDYFMACANEYSNSDAYLYDLVDFTRQALLGEIQITYKNIVESYKNKDLNGLEKYSKKFIELAEAEEKILSTRPEFLLGNWIDKARKIAETDKEKDLFEQNARMLITTWGYAEQHEILNDYAHREWAGLISDFYLPRWKLFLEYLQNNLAGKNSKLPDFKVWEEEWTKKKNSFTTQTVGNTIDLSRKIYSEMINK